MASFESRSSRAQASASKKSASIRSRSRRRNVDLPVATPPVILAWASADSRVNGRGREADGVDSENGGEASLPAAKGVLFDKRRRAHLAGGPFISMVGGGISSGRPSDSTTSSCSMSERTGLPSASSSFACDEDDEVLFDLLIHVGAEKASNERHVAEKGNLVLDLLDVLAHEAAQRDRHSVQMVTFVVTLRLLKIG